MKRLALILLVLAAGGYGYLADWGPSFHGDPEPWQQAPSHEAPEPPQQATSTLAKAFRQHRSDLQVRGEGVVSRVLPDDREGRRHQRFILRLPDGLSVLVAHNIDLAPPIPSLEKGDRVAFFGEYEWNAKGGVIHWTHHDPGGRHPDGWIKHRGRTYE